VDLVSNSDVLAFLDHNVLFLIIHPFVAIALLLYDIFIVQCQWEAKSYKLYCTDSILAWNLNILFAVLVLEVAAGVV